jgi:hypothetical protein
MMRATILHFVNPLHIYCRLRNLGIPKSKARRICETYEFSVFNYLRGKNRRKRN